MSNVLGGINVATIKDVARLANVSISTVSYALNGGERVAASTRNRIFDSARQLNYVPNAAARSLKTKKTGIIGVRITTFAGSFFNRIASGIEQVVSPLGYSLVICTGERSEGLIGEGLFDGTIVLDHNFSDEHLLSFASTSRPVVVLDREIDHPNIVSVLLDNENGVLQAMTYCYHKGFRFFYIIEGPSGTFDADKRLFAVKQFLLANHDVEAVFLPGDFKKVSGYKAAEHIITRGLNKQCVICLNDDMAIGMYDFFNKTTFRIGEDIHIMGFDNIDVSNYLSPRLTTVGYSEEEWGKVAAQSLIDIIDGKTISNQMIHTVVIEGKSVGRFYG